MKSENGKDYPGQRTIDAQKTTQSSSILGDKKAIAEDFKKLLTILLSTLKWMLRYSGAEFIYRKFNPSEKTHPLPTGVLWIIGI